MCVFGCGDIVIACIQNVGLGIDVVVRLQLLLIKGDRYGFACAGSQLCSFGIAHQLHSSLFHLVCLVVIGIGALCIDLYDILVTRLIVAIADVNALFVADIVILGDISVFIIISKVTEVLSSGAVHCIDLISINSTSRGVDLAGEDLCQRAQTVIAHCRSRDDGMDAGIVLDPAQVNCCAGIEQKNHIIKVVVQILKDLQLRRIRLQIGLGLVLFHIGVVVHGGAYHGLRPPHG